MKTALVCVVVVLALAGLALSDLSHGFNDKIAWKTFEEGKALAASTGKPIFLLIHKSWCGACKNLKGQFQNSEEIVAKSESFIMVNTEDAEEPTGAEFTPDGG